MKYLRALLSFFLLYSAAAIAEDKAVYDANSYYEKAISAFEQEQLEESYIYLKNALKKDANYLPAKLLLGKVYFNAGNIFAAENEFEECLELGLDINLVLPLYGSALILQKKTDKLLGLRYYEKEFSPSTQFEWYLLKGQAHLQKRQPDRAVEAFEKARSIYPVDTRALNTLASIYLEQGFEAKAIELVDQSLAISAQNEKTWKLKGEIAYRAERLDAALEYFHKAYDIDPEDMAILHGLSKIYMQQKRFAEAQPFLAAILEVSPGDPVATILYAIALLNLNDEEKGRAILDDLGNTLSDLDEGTLKKGGYSADFIRAATEFIQGNQEKAKVLLGTYLHSNPGNVVAIRMLTDILTRENRPGAVVQLLESQERYISSDYGLTLQLAYLYAEARKFYRAEAQLKKLKALDANHPYTLLMEVEILTAREDYDAALKRLNSRTFASAEPLDVSLKRGDLQLKTNQLKKAVATSKDLLKRHPDHPAVLNFAAIAAMHVQDIESAKTYLDSVLERYPDNPIAVYHFALLQKMQGKYDEAVASAKAFLKTRPDHVPSLLLISRTKLIQRLPDEALEWVKKASLNSTENILVHELLLDIYTQKREWDKALDALSQLRKFKPVETKYLAQQAKILIQLGKFKEAQKPLYLLSSLWESQPDKLLELSGIQIASNNLTAAKQSLKMALKLKPKSSILQYELAKIHVMEGRFDLAKNTIGKLSKQSVLKGELALLEGDIARINKDLSTARKYYNKAFQVDSTRQSATIQLYQLTIQGEGEKEFSRLLSGYLKKNSATPLPWMQKVLADSYLNQGEVGQAKLQYESLLELPALADDPEILNNLANIYALTDLDKAMATARRGLQKGSRFPALLDTIGWLLIQQNKNSEALSYLRDAFALESRNPEIRYHQGVALMNLGRDVEALKELNAAVNLGKQFSGYEDAQQRIKRIQ